MNTSKKGEEDIREIEKVNRNRKVKSAILTKLASKQGVWMMLDPSNASTK